MPIVFAKPVQPLVFFDDFESYAAGDIPSQTANYTAENYNGGATWQRGGTINKVLVVNTSGDSRAIMQYNPWMFTNGRVRSRVVHSTAGIADNFTRPGLMCRLTNSTNYVAAYMANDTNQLVIDDFNGTLTSVNTSFSPASDVAYYFELLFGGASVTATVYSDSGYSTVLATVGKTVNKTSAGTAGIFVKNDTSIAIFDDLEIVNNG